MNVRQWLVQANRADAAAYAAVARIDTPPLDAAMSRLSDAANYTRLWIGLGGLLAVAGGEKNRRAAADGLASLAVTATVVNAVLKPLGRRRRPVLETPQARHVRMPKSRSFPSGHAAAGFAFSTAVARTRPRLAVPLRLLAAVVGYSRIHTGVHFPGDVLIGSLLGVLLARATVWATGRRRS